MKLKAKNIAFLSKTPKERRIIVAKDILKQLEEKTIFPKERVYIKVLTTEEDRDLQFDNYFNKKAREGEQRICSACALGACLISYTLFANQLNVRDVSTSSKGDITKFLRGTFKKDQLDLIETAFEMRQMAFSGDPLLAITFGKQYLSPKNRLKGIMKNIIENNGIFKP